MKTPKESLDITKEKIAQLRQIFPEVITEGKVDFTKLKLTLGAQIEDKDEHYSFNWAGRKDAFKNIQTTAKGTLTPDKKESINFDSTENLFIEGDNLEALKLLQKAYFNKIKMIYIDPPYNTGNDFVYKDDFKNSIDAYLKQTGQANGDSIKLTTNPETSGRYHSDWISMMYPRLFLARNLLEEDGVIFISIDDNEVKNLRNIMDEIYGEENLLASLVWNLRSGSQAGHFTHSHEYVVCYAKNKEKLSYFRDADGGEIKHGALKKISKENPESIIEFPAGIAFEGDSATFAGTIGDSEKQTIVSNKMIFENGKLKYPTKISAGWAMKNQVLSWISGKETFDSKGQKVIRFYFNKQGILWYEKERQTVHPKTVLPEDIGSTKKGGDELTEIFGNKLLDFPKPNLLIRYFAKIVCTNHKDIIIDFFAGSGTTAQAVLELNKEDNGNRKFILVQLPEQTDEKSDAFKAGFKSIADITKERIRRVIKKLNDEVKQQKLSSKDGLDLGFKVFKLGKSNYRIWENYEGKDENELKKQLQLFKDPLVKGYNDLDVIYECIIKEGLTLNAKIEELKVKQNKVYKVSEQEQNFYITLDSKVNSNALDELKLKKDDFFICLDDALDDSKKANLATQCKVKTL